VLAKVYRDRLLVELDQQFPGYGLASHKGYCSQEHLEALARLGPTPLHRKSFNPVAQRLLPFDSFDSFDELEEGPIPVMQ
jgi:ribonuclease HII